MKNCRKKVNKKEFLNQGAKDTVLCMLTPVSPTELTGTFF